MYPISDDDKVIFKTSPRQVAEITLSGTGQTRTITEADILSGGLTVDRYCISGDKLEVGSAIASELALKLNNNDGRFDSFVFEGAELFVRIGAVNPEDGLPRFIPFGYFIVDGAPRKLAAISLTALDRMVLFDKDYDSTLSYPATVAEILVDACNNCNVELATIASTLLNWDYVVQARPDTDGLTYRQILQWVAEITCTCAYLDWDGRLRLEWYQDTQEQILLADRYSSDINENSITLDGFEVELDETVYHYGGDSYYLKSVNNGLIQQAPDTVAASVGAALEGFIYTPYECSTRPMPYLFPLDKIKVQNKNRDLIDSIVTHMNFTMQGKQTVAGKGVTGVEAARASANPLTQREQAIINVIKDKVNESLGDREQTLIGFNEIMANALGLYSTRIRQSDGSVQWYLHDGKDLETSRVIYTINAGGFAWTDSGWQDGNPVWEYGATKNGNAIFRTVSAYGVEVADPNQDYSAQMIPTGFDIYYRTQRILTVNGDETELTKLLVKNQLNCGKTRLVPHEQGADLVILD